MLYIFQIIAILIVVVAVTPTLAHALELPGKMRLSKDNYYAVQTIYYPGYTTAGGVGEAGSIVFTLILLILTPLESSDFWLTLLALLGIISMQGIYWLFTHPVNKFWVEGEKLNSFSSDFFSFASGKGSNQQVEWTELRDRWEYSHVARAVFSVISLIALLFALA